VGLKPTNGLVARWPIPSWIDLSTSGPMATSAADARLLLDVLRSPLRGDPAELPPWDPRREARPSRILASERLVDHGPVPAGIAGSFDRALAALGSATGLPIEPLEAPPFDGVADDDWFLQAAVEELTWVGRERADREADRLSRTAAVFRIAAGYTLDEYVASRRRRFTYARTLDELLAGDAVIATPTMCVEGFTPEGVMPGRDEPGTPDEAYNTQVQNLTGHPAISLPAGLSGNGVPFGLQLTGPRFADDLLLWLAERWEEAVPWPLAAPGYEPFTA
jgi:Asp-tRNA(Asn)/Glu-tRNA(Gln) amidotransferase A subunit family amidase